MVSLFLSLLHYYLIQIHIGPPPQEEFSKELIPKTLLATKFIQARVIYHWLFDLVKDYVARYAEAQTL